MLHWDSILLEIGVPQHVDAHSTFDAPIILLSLVAAVVMEFKTGQEWVSVVVPRRSLLIMSDEARYISSF